MSSLEEEELINTLPKDGPSLEEIKKYLDKYNDEFIVIKCGGSVLINPNLFNIFIQDIAILKSDSSFIDPPILITIYSFLYLSKYFLTS